MEDNILQDIEEKLNRPEGTVSMKSTVNWLFDSSVGDKVLFQEVVRERIFRVERNSELILKFYQSSPGTGTRVASIDLNKIKKDVNICWGFTWSPEEIMLFIGPDEEDCDLTFSKGSQADKELRAVNGEVVQLGDKGVEVMGARIFADGKPVLEPTAIKVWKEMIESIKVLKNGSTSEEYRHDVVIGNMIIANLVTGFEVYFETRFIELEEEGVTPDIDAIVERFFSEKDKENNRPEQLKTIAQENGITFLEHIAKKRINFQNYNQCKSAFNKAYDLKFGEVIDKNHILAEIKKYIQYRHRIIHVSPMISMLNQPNVPPEKPDFAGRNIAEKAEKDFDYLITQFHKASLNLKS